MVINWIETSGPLKYINLVARTGTTASKTCPGPELMLNLLQHAK